MHSSQKRTSPTVPTLSRDQPPIMAARTTAAPLLLLLLLLAPPAARGFGIAPPPLASPAASSSSSSSSTSLASSAAAAFAEAGGSNVVDANRYNVDLDLAASLWTAKVQETNSNAREAGVPFLATSSKDYFVDDAGDVTVSRDGGMGLELLELAGGREDGFGITIVTAVTEGGNAAAAGILPGDSIASISVTTEQTREDGAQEVTRRSAGTECLDFDGTMAALADFPGEAPAVILGLKRIRRWPKIKVRVEYPPIQCAEGADNHEDLVLDAGENLKRALQTRGIVMEDPDAPKCDYCGNKCNVSVGRAGMHLLSPMSTTEEKIMKRNPDLRLSCKTTVGHNMQEGELTVRVNVRQWNKER